MARGLHYVHVIVLIPVVLSYQLRTSAILSNFRAAFDLAIRARKRGCPVVLEFPRFVNIACDIHVLKPPEMNRLVLPPRGFSGFRFRFPAVSNGAT